MTKTTETSNTELDNLTLAVLKKRTKKCGDRNYWHLMGHLMDDPTLRGFSVVEMQHSFRRLLGASKAKLSWNGSKIKLF